MRGFYFIIICSLIAGCNSTVQKGTINDASKAAGAVNPGNQEMVSAKLVQEQVLNSCASCHAGRAAPLLNTLSGIRSQISSIWTDVSGGFMPPQDQGYTALTSCKQEILKKWIDMGTPDQTQIRVGDLVSCASSVTNPTPTPAPSKVFITSALILNPVLASCARCHSSMATVSGIKKRISSIWSDVNSGSMPPAGPLSACNKAILKKWIDLGQPDQSQVAVTDLPACKK